ncbi:hypothetical protein HFN89_05280 [Rhizobium laguerreae]|nr:hypothetical protein [Rhizobium laguerreae]
MPSDIIGPDGRIKPELVKALVKEGIEKAHKRDYEAALDWAGEDGPAWEDLTDEQRARIRQANIEHRQAMHAFGKSLAASNNVGRDDDHVGADQSETDTAPVSSVAPPRAPRS